jgi:hypothetical protein
VTYEAAGEKLVPYSCRHGYAHRAHVICDLPARVVRCESSQQTETIPETFSKTCLET